MSDQQQRQPHPMETAQQQIYARSAEFARVLPPGISGEMFARVSITALQNRPELALADRRSLFLALMKAAEDGLLPDGREGALNIYNTKVKDRDGKEVWIKAVQWLPMVEGVRKLLWNAGIVLETGVVYKQDDWEYRRGDDPRIIHTPKPGRRSRADMVAVYSIARFPDGRVHRDWLWAEEVEQLRTTYSRSADGAAWKNDASYPEMAIKSVVHHHSKSLPASAELRAMVNRPEFWDSHPESTPATLTERSAAAAIAHMPAMPMEPIQDRPARTVEGVMGALADGEQVEAPARQRRQRQPRNGVTGGNGAPPPNGGGGGGAIQQHHAPALQPAQQETQQGVMVDTDGTSYDQGTGEVIEDHEAQEAAQWRERASSAGAISPADDTDIPPNLRRRSAADHLQDLADSPQPASRAEYVPWFETKLEFAKTPEAIEALRQWWKLTEVRRKELGVTSDDYRDFAARMKGERANA